MGQAELLPQAPLLRIRLRFRQHDFLWKKVCDELRLIWEQTEIAYTNQLVEPRQRAYKRKPKENKENRTVLPVILFAASTSEQKFCDISHKH